MVRIVLGGIFGGIAFFLWGAIIWMGVKLPAQVISNLPAEEVVVAALKTNVPEHGVYFFPAMPEHAASATREEKKAATEAWNEKHKAGPTGLLFIHPGGIDAGQPIYMIRGLGLMMLTALLASILLYAASGRIRSYIGRVSFLTMIGAVIVVYADGSNWNWWNYPTDYTMFMAVDRIGGWLFAGLVIAAIVKAPRLQK